MDLLFNIFILPIEWLMKTILEGVFALTNNYVISLIILSIGINILILPLHYLAEHLKYQHTKIIGNLQLEIDVLKDSYSGQQKHYYLQTLYKIYNYHPLSGVKASLGLLFQIPFFFAAFHLIGNYPAFEGVSFGFIDDLSKPDNLLLGQNLLPVLMTLINLFSTYFYVRNISRSDKYQLWGLSAIFLILLYFESAALLLYWTMSNIFSLGKNWMESKLDVAKFRQMSVNFFLLPIQWVKQNKIFNFISRDLFFQAITLCFGAIFIYQAIPMAASDTGMYAASYGWVVINLVTFFVVSVATTLLIYYFLPKKLQSLVVILTTFAAFVVLFNAFIVPFEMEQLRSLTMPFTRLSRDIHHLITFEVKLLKLLQMTFFLVCWFFIFRKIKGVVWIILLLSNLFLTLQAISIGINPKEFNVMSKDNLEISTEQAKNFYAFSNESNTIVIMFDGFQGNMFSDILTKYPGIKQKLSGFTYYPNTLSHGAATWLSMSAVVGGEEFQTQLMHKQVDYKKYKTEYQQSYYIPKIASRLHVLSMAKKYNHSYSIYSPAYANCNLFDAFSDEMICSRQVITDNRIRLSKDDKTSSVYENSNFKVAKFFLKVSIVLSIPNVIKERVARFLKGNDLVSQMYDYNLQEYSQLSNMTNFSNLGSDKKTLKYIDNNLTHVSWMVDEKCNLRMEVFEGYQGLFNSAFCSVRSLSKFFDRLKHLGIYDKTKIIIVSDHGIYNMKVKTKELNSNISGAISQAEFRKLKKKTNTSVSKASALMLVKDFNQVGDLRTSMELLSNIDTYGIALSGVSENTEVELDRIKTPKPNRTLIHVKKTDPYESYNVIEAFKVKSNIFNWNNWQELNKEQIDLLSK
jgi:YidC/Oxa1 family membrane protein insertase